MAIDSRAVALLACGYALLLASLSVRLLLPRAEGAAIDALVVVDSQNFAAYLHMSIGAPSICVY